MAPKRRDSSLHNARRSLLQGWFPRAGMVPYVLRAKIVLQNSGDSQQQDGSKDKGCFLEPGWFPRTAMVPNSRNSFLARGQFSTANMAL
jgi:hypothetical protein